MNAKTIYDMFTSAGMTAEGACAMLGNFMAESTSNLVPNQVQFNTTKLTNEQYTAAIDNGLMDFRDDIGYGLAQWTLASRKENLLRFARANGVSVGDGPMQVRFAIHELQTQFHTIWADLCSSSDLYSLTKVVCDVYENPSVHNVGTRYEYAKQVMQEIRNPKPVQPKDPVEATFPPDPSVKQIQYVMWDNGYWDIDKINGRKSKEFFEKLREFTDDMERC